MRKEMEQDPFYAQCCITGRTNEKIEWHHNLIYAGKKVQKKFCILPLVKSIHDNVFRHKNLCDWIMLNRATDEEIKSISKSIDYEFRRDALNAKFGEWKGEESYRTIQY